MINEQAILHLKSVCPRLSRLIDEIGEIDIHKHTDSFLFLTQEIIGQMISIGAKKVIFERLVKLCDGYITPEHILKLNVEELHNIGLSKAKSEYIINLARNVQSQAIDFERLNLLSDEEILKILISLKGIGSWTAKMYLLFFLEREDVLPFEDGAFLQAYRWLCNTKKCEQKSIERRCKKWKPYSSIGARYLYAALNSGLTKRNIVEFMIEGKVEKK